MRPVQSERCKTVVLVRHALFYFPSHVLDHGQVRSRCAHGRYPTSQVPFVETRPLHKIFGFFESIIAATKKTRVAYSGTSTAWLFVLVLLVAGLHALKPLWRKKEGLPLVDGGLPAEFSCIDSLCRIAFLWVFDASPRLGAVLHAHCKLGFTVSPFFPTRITSKNPLGGSIAVLLPSWIFISGVAESKSSIW